MNESSTTQTLQRYLPLAAIAGLLVLINRALIGHDPYYAIRSRINLPAAEEFFFSPTGSSPALIFTLSLWFLYSRRHRLLASLARPGGVAGSAALLGLGCFTAVWSYYIGEPDLLIPSIVILVLGGAHWLGGRDGVRAVMLPALFLLLLIPIPAVLINAVVFPLQIATAETVAAVLGLLQMPAVVHGDQIITTGKIFQVIETCSGLRAVETLAMTAIVYSELFFRNRLQATVLFLLTPFLGLLVNLTRVLSLVLNPFSDVEVVHTVQGMAMLFVGVIALAGVDWVLTKILPHNEASLAPWQVDAAALPAASSATTATPRAAALCGLLALLALTTWLVPTWEPERPAAQSLYAFPSRLEGWKSQGINPDTTFLGTVRFTEQFYRRFEKDGQTVELLLGSDEHLTRVKSLISRKTAIPASGYEIEGYDTIALEPDDRPAEVLVVSSRRDRFLVVHWYERIADLGEETLRSLLALDRGPLRRTDRSVVVRLAVPIESEPDGLDRAEATMSAFIPIVRDQLDLLSRPKQPKTKRPKAA